MNKGKLIVLDGLDGCGKSTQFEIVSNILKEKNYKVKPISFPDYDNPSSTLVKMYLNGEFSSNPSGVNAYAASSFYAVDRYSSFKLLWEKEYNDNYIILASRYTTSNAIHQMEKLPENEWDNYLDWLSDYEYIKLGLPQPDLTIFLDMPVEVSQKLMTSRYNGDENKKDIHESDVNYLISCRKSALYASSKQNWKVIECSKDGMPLKIEEITEKIINTVNNILD